MASRRDQAVQRHGAGEAAGARVEAEVLEDPVEAEAAPERQADMDRPGLAVALGGDLVGLDGDRRTAGAAALGALPAGAHLGQDGLDLRVDGLVEELGLVRERLLDLVGQLEPLVARPRRQVAQRADGLLPGAFGGADGFDQDIVGVDPVLVAP